MNVLSIVRIGILSTLLLLSNVLGLVLEIHTNENCPSNINTVIYTEDIDTAEDDLELDGGPSSVNTLLYFVFIAGHDSFLSPSVEQQHKNYWLLSKKYIEIIV